MAIVDEGKVRPTYCIELGQFEEGQIHLVRPDRMSPESIAEFEEWLALIIRKLKARPLTDEVSGPRVEE